MSSLELARTSEFYNPDLDLMQDDVVDALGKARDENVDRCYINIVMGGGKTRIIRRDIENFLEDTPDARVLYLCHDANVLDQAMDEFDSQLSPNIAIGSILKGNLDDETQITMASFHQLNREITPGGQKLYEIIPKDHYDYIVVDESHHGPAPTYKQVIEHFTPTFLRGMTGTANRLDRQDIGKIFGRELYFVSLEEAIARRFVSPLDYRIFSEEMQHDADDEADGLSFQEIVDNEFVKRDPTETVRIIKEQIADIEHPRMMVFCSTTKEAELYADLLGGRSAALHSKLHPKEQERILKAYKSGELDTITAVEMMNEGVDVRDTNVVAFVRSTESEAIYLQQLGRGLRRAIGKDSVRVLDFVANFDRVQYIAALQDRLQSASKVFPRASGEAVPFKFSYSQETKQVLRHIARMRRRFQRGDDNVEAIEALLGSKLSQGQRLSQHSEMQLIKAVREGDTDAKRTYLSYRARSVYSAIRNIPEMNGLTKADYFQIGALTLFEHIQNPAIAVGDNYLAKMNVKIKAEVAKALRDSGVPLDESTEAVIELRGVKVRPEAVITWKQAKQAGHFIEEPTEKVHTSIQNEAYFDKLEELSYRERRVLDLRYGLTDNPKTLDEVAKTFNVSRERIRQIEGGALKKLSSMLVTQNFEEGGSNLTVQASNQFEQAAARSLGYPTEKAQAQTQYGFFAQPKKPRVHGPKSSLVTHEPRGLSAILNHTAAERARRRSALPVQNAQSQQSAQTASNSPLVRELEYRAKRLNPRDIETELLRTAFHQRRLRKDQGADYDGSSIMERKIHQSKVTNALQRLDYWRKALESVRAGRL